MKNSTFKMNFCLRQSDSDPCCFSCFLRSCSHTLSSKKEFSYKDIVFFSLCPRHPVLLCFMVDNLKIKKWGLFLFAVSD